jgi:two-component system capsular synthesis sensor histidine kinase RcsC
MLITQPLYDDDRGRSILIVDDDEMILELLTGALKIYGFKVFTAGDGVEGLRIFDNECIDIVLTDIEMPGLNGVELAAHIQNRSPNTKIIVMTGGYEDVGNKLVEDGTADHCFLKPFSISNLCKTLTAECQVI